MESVVLAVSVGVIVMISFYLGARVGQKVSKGEEIKAPNPVRAIEEHKAAVEAKEARAVFETNMANIDAYDGTAYGQRDFE